MCPLLMVSSVIIPFLCFVFARGEDLNIALRGTFEQCSKTNGAYN